MTTVNGILPEAAAPPVPVSRFSMRAGLALLAIALSALVAILWFTPLARGTTAAWRWLIVNGSGASLRWLVSVLPGAIILNHLVYLLSSRRKQFRQALGKLEQSEVNRLEDLYFGYWPMTVRYVVPAILVTILTATAIAALTDPAWYLSWLYEPPVPASTKAWPAGWAHQTLRGAALGFLGAYVYVLLLLTGRAQQRDITTGVAVWAASMPVLGPMMGGVAALLIVAGTGVDTSFTQDAVFFVAGMLPRQFMMFVQSSVRRMFQNGAPSVTRTLPLTMLRGVGPDVEARLAEEGIYDVSALAYASPHSLMRATTYAPRQITDWIDEALLIATLPSHWEPLEKVGVTGAMDLAWYETRPDAIKPLADEIKIASGLLTDVIQRLAQDAQVADLYQLYWDHSAPTLLLAPAQRPPANPSQGLNTPAGPPAPPSSEQPDGASLSFAFGTDILKEARERLIAEIQARAGVRSARMDGDSVAIVVESAQRDALDRELQGKAEFQHPG